jgi:hypothetical protein
LENGNEDSGIFGEERRRRRKVTAENGNQTAGAMLKQTAKQFFQKLSPSSFM